MFPGLVCGPHCLFLPIFPAAGGSSVRPTAALSPPALGTFAFRLNPRWLSSSSSSWLPSRTTSPPQLLILTHAVRGKARIDAGPLSMEGLVHVDAGHPHVDAEAQGGSTKAFIRDGYSTARGKLWIFRELQFFPFW